MNEYNMGQMGDLTQHRIAAQMAQDVEHLFRKRVGQEISARGRCNCANNGNRVS